MIRNLKYHLQEKELNIIPFIAFESFEEANKLDNLTCLCEPCHREAHRGETITQNIKINTFLRVNDTVCTLGRPKEVSGTETTYPSD